MPRSSADSCSKADDTEAMLYGLLERLLPELRQFLHSRTGPAIRAKESCSDLEQSVCLEILTDLERFQFRGEAAFKQWLYTTALRKLMDRARFWGAQRRTPDREISELPETDPALCSTATPSQILMSREAIDEIERAFADLPVEYQEVIMMLRICNVPRSEVAQYLNRSESAITKLLFRALSRLSFLLTRARG